MASTKPLSDEEIRILRATAAGRMHLNQSGRYEIEGEPRPDQKARQALSRRCLIVLPFRDGRSRVTPEGRAYLSRLDGGSDG